ncbi:MAG: hypothetical protein IJ060_06965 [Oscillospiraceae bacterium]|nr:hypothetical protein [Oscillospiraceae bacterium]
MKKLLKHMSPLAPDDSGACGVLYEMGGITVICDAGGCAGNVCGFDEPRWHTKKSALFSAGLRDMDAILGRDDLLVHKLSLICGQIDAPFTAIVGTPVPAVIATDFHALERMSERKTGLPCLTLETDGTRRYDYGEALAYDTLFRRFAAEQYPVKPGSLGVIGVTPLNTGFITAEPLLRSLSGKGYSEITCFGMDSGLEAVIRASECESLLVIAPSGLKAAQYLQKNFGTPFSVGYPCLPAETVRAASALRGKRVLIIHQQFAANALREHLTDCEADCAAWFKQEKQYALPGDFRIAEEETLVQAAERYDVIIADAVMRRIVPRFAGEWIDFPHYAVSGCARESGSLS